MLDLKFNFFKNHLEKELLLIPSNESAFSLSSEIDRKKIVLTIALNSIDSEILVITKFIKLFTDYVLSVGEKNNYHYSIITFYLEDEITEIEIAIHKN